MSFTDSVLYVLILVCSFLLGVLIERRTFREDNAPFVEPVTSQVD